MSIDGVGVGKFKLSVSQSLGHEQSVYLSREPPFSGSTVRAPEQESFLCYKVISVCFGPLSDSH